MSEFFGDYFIDAVKDNNHILVNKLLESNNNYDIQKAMMIACSYGYNTILSLLIRKGGNVNMHNNHLLTLAIMSKNYETVTILFENNIILKKHVFIISYCLNNIKMFRHILKYIDVIPILKDIFVICEEKNNYRMTVELIRRNHININRYNNISVMIANNMINNIISIYTKLLYRINKKINHESHNIISFIF